MLDDTLDSIRIKLQKKNTTHPNVIELWNRQLNSAVANLMKCISEANNACIIMESHRDLTYNEIAAISIIFNKTHEDRHLTYI